MKKKKVALLLATTTGIATISIPVQNVHATTNGDKTLNCGVNIQDTAIRTNIKKGKVINVDTNLRIRKNNTINSQIIGYLSNEQEFNIINQKDDWYEITHNGQTGYVYKDYVEILSSSNVKEVKNNVNQIGYVANVSSNLNVRNTPNLNSDIVGNLYEGQAVKIKNEQGNWYEVDYDGKSAYVSKDYITKDNTNKNKNAGQVKIQLQSKQSNNNCLDFSKGQVFNISSNLRVRSNAGFNYDVLGYLSNEEVFNIKSKVGDWYEIDFKGNSGYVHRDYVKKASNDIVNKLIKQEKNSEKPQNEINNISNKGIILNISTNLRIRQGASINSATLGYLVNGQNVNIKGKAGDWYKIECDGKSGFVNKNYVSVKGKLDVPSINPNSTNTNSTVKINTKQYGQVCNVVTNLRLRSQANSNSDIVAYLLPNTTFEVIETVNGWNKICCDGKVGYVLNNFVKKIDEALAKSHINNIKTNEAKQETSKIDQNSNTNSEKIETSNLKGYQAVLNAMKSQIGAPYLFGGSGQPISQSVINSLKAQFPYNASRGDYNVGSKFINNKYRAFDCSGLMQWGFSQAGINLGRTTWEQIGAGSEIAKNSVQPGDLLFFRNIEHVGMYIGNNQWIEAPKHGDVVKITSVPWNRIGRARRVLK